MWQGKKEGHRERIRCPNRKAFMSSQVDSTPTAYPFQHLKVADLGTYEKHISALLEASIGKVFHIGNCGIPVVPLRVDFPYVVYLLDEHGLVVQRSRISELGIIL